MKNSATTKKGYTLVKISKSEIKRQGLSVYSLGNINYLVALKENHTELKKSDPNTWGVIFKGGNNFGEVIKKYSNIPNRSIYIICEKPVHSQIGIKRQKDMFGNYTDGWTYTCNGQTTFKNFKTAYRVGQSNKAVYGVRIGHAIN